MGTEKLVLERIEQDQNSDRNLKSGENGKDKVDTETHKYSNILKLLRILEKTKLKNKNSENKYSGVTNLENVKSLEIENSENESLDSKHQDCTTPNKKRKLSPP